MQCPEGMADARVSRYRICSLVAKLVSVDAVVARGRYLPDHPGAMAARRQALGFLMAIPTWLRT
jgi:hypothetical protein